MEGYWCYDCNVTKAYFESRNFYTVLRWDAVDIPGQEIRYHVQYIKYGASARPVTQCQNISVPFCDLTSVTTDVRSRYYVKIMVNKMCGQYVFFSPFEQTILGAPQLSTSLSGSSLTVRATVPMGPQNRSIDKISCWEKCQGSDEASINYIVHLTSPESEVGRQPFENKSGVITLNHLELGREYCGTVLYQLTHPAVERRSENSTFCVTLPGKLWNHVFLMPALLAFFLLLTSAFVLCQLYVTRKSPEPHALKQLKSYYTAYYSDPQVEIADVKICPEFIKNTDKPEPHSPPVLHGSSKAASNKSDYATQVHHGQPWHCQSYTTQRVPPVRTCDQNTESSTSYSIVVAASVPDPEEPSQFAKDGCVRDTVMSGTSGPVFSGEDRDSFQVLCNPQRDREMGTLESDCDLLVLPVLRDNNGNLKFSSIAFQSEFSSALSQSPGNTAPVTGMTPAGEKSPLLTNLVTTDESEWLGSELGLNYKRTYLANQAPQSCSVFPSAETVPLASNSDRTSNYRQNWVPGFSPETQLNNKDCTGRVVRLHSSTELEEEDEEEEETQPLFGSITLGGWMVQIQG